MRELAVRLNPPPPPPRGGAWREAFFFLVSFLATFGGAVLMLDHAAALMA